MYINPFSLQMTGRKGRVVRRPDGTVRYESRAEQGLTIDHINLKEKDRFMSGEKVRYFTVQKIKNESLFSWLEGLQIRVHQTVKCFKNIVQ